MRAAIRIAEDAALFVLDDEGVFFSESRQELHIFNTPATFIWCCLEEQLGLPAIVAAFAETFRTEPHEARHQVSTVLARWQGLGHISGADLSGAPAVDLPTTLGRLLTTPGLRRELRQAPLEAARRLGVRREEVETLRGLDLEALERQAEMLADRQATLRRGAGASGIEHLLARMFDRRRTELEVAAAWRLRAPRAPVAVRHYRLLSTAFAVRFASLADEARVHPALAHLETDGPASREVVLELLAGRGGYVLVEDVVPVGHCRRPAELAPLVKLRVRQTALNRHRYFLDIHAAVVLAGDRALLLPGVAGSGKSTLAAALARTGFRYGSDEAAVLEGNPLEVRPVPLSLCVKPGAVAPLSAYYPEVGRLSVHRREDGQEVRYLPPPRPFADDQQTYSVRWIVFPRYAPEEPTALTPLPRPEALRRLMRECLTLPEPLDRGRAESLVGFMREVECFELSMRTLPETLACLEKVTGAPLAPRRGNRGRGREKQV